ncbi:phage gp6-like head-tail connector protein [Romboutsia ilealis]|nr:phage gp6-like head-tail connector protein [Romboutsia ilealis]
MPNTGDGQERGMHGIFHSALHINSEGTCAIDNYLIDCVSVKKHLNIEEDFHTDDEIINGYCIAALEYVQDYTGISEIDFGNEVDGVKNYSLGLAVLLLAGHFYEQRQVYIDSNSDINFTLKSILTMKKENWI